jgi:methionine-R-sulfoxide reductase
MFPQLLLQPGDDRGPLGLVAHPRLHVNDHLPAELFFLGQAREREGRGQLVGPVEVDKVIKTEAEWAGQLTPEQYRVARGKGTERPFCGNLLDNKRRGVYACVCCRLPLFASQGKFDSGTGWPSFFRPVADENVATQTDRSHGMLRTEILCARCDAHLGHVFPDGPPPTGLRFCVNSESLVFTDEAGLAGLADPAAETAR